MRQILLTLLLVVGFPFSALAQQERDFASQYMRLYNNENGSLTCNTVSPLMMQRILQLDEVENDEEAHRLISQIKSIQILTAKDPTAYAQHFEQAKELADRYHRNDINRTMTLLREKIPACNKERNVHREDYFFSNSSICSM